MERSMAHFVKSVCHDRQHVLDLCRENERVIEESVRFQELEPGFLCEHIDFKFKDGSVLTLSDEAFSAHKKALPVHRFLKVIK